MLSFVSTDCLNPIFSAVDGKSQITVVAGNETAFRSGKKDRYQIARTAAFIENPTGLRVCSQRGKHQNDN